MVRRYYTKVARRMLDCGMFNMRSNGRRNISAILVAIQMTLLPLASRQVGHKRYFS